MGRPSPLLTAALAIALAADAALGALLLASAARHRPTLFDGWRRADENASTGLIAIVRVAAVCAALALARVPRAHPNGAAAATTGRSPPALALSLACQASGALLGSKALAIALLTPDGAWPGRGPCRTGLVPLFAALCAGAAAAAFERWAGGRAVAAVEAAEAAAASTNAAKRRMAASGAGEDGASTAPLLEEEGGEGGEEGNGSAPPPRGGGPGLDLEAGPPVPPASHTLAVLARIAAADAPWLAAAFAAGAAAAVGGALIPHYTGGAIDDVTLRPPSPAAFRSTLGRLAGAAAFTAAATATRGGLFWVIGVRLNVRTRTRLFASLLKAEAGFFDAARLGDLVSRLSADTAAVSDNLSLQLNVLARSLIGGAVVLAFMVRASWRLSVLAGLVLPLVAAVSKVFGRIYRDLAKQSQAALADANAAAEEVLGTMATVKAHAAEGAARASYGAGLAAFASIQAASGRAYAAYALASTGLPALLATGVLAAGGDLVLAGRMSGGSLISFLLYQTSLSGTIQTLGDVFSAVSAAVG